MKIINSKYNSNQLYKAYENRRRTILDKIDNLGPEKAIFIGLILLAVGFFSIKICSVHPILKLIGLSVIFLLGGLLLTIGAMLLSYGGASELSPKYSILLDIADLLAFCEDAFEENLELLRYEDGLIAIKNGGSGNAEFVDQLYMEDWLQKVFTENALDLSVFDDTIEKTITTVSKPGTK